MGRDTPLYFGQSTGINHFCWSRVKLEGPLPEGGRTSGSQVFMFLGVEPSPSLLHSTGNNPRRFRRDFWKTQPGPLCPSLLTEGGQKNEWPLSLAVKPQRRCQVLVRLSLHRTAGGVERQGLLRPSAGLGVPAAGAHCRVRDLKGAGPPSAPLPPGAQPQPAADSAEKEETLETPKFGDSGGVAAIPEPFPRLRQVSGGPGKLADNPTWKTEVGLAAPSPSCRELTARAPRRSAKVMSPRRTCASQLPLDAGRCPLQSLQQHSPMAAVLARSGPAAPLLCSQRRRLLAPPGARGRCPARVQCRAGSGTARGAAGQAAPLPSLSFLAPRCGHPGLGADPANQ